MRVAFIMPEISVRPIGAAKIIYAYADNMSTRGHRVVLIHPQHSLLTSQRSRFDMDRELSLIGGGEHASTPRDQPIASSDPHPWYASRSGVENIIVQSLDEGSIGGPYDVIVATNRQVVSVMHRYSPSIGRKMYFLQDYESYLIGDSREREESRRVLQHVDWPIVATSLVISRLVKSTTGRSCRVVPCGIDKDVFRLLTPVDSQRRVMIGFQARTELTKRTADALRALELAKPQIPANVKYWCFGYEHLAAIPPWITQHVASSDDILCELYNGSKLFLVSSEHEGFGLPGAEAMTCGPR